jgi:hypothetical protein
LTARKRQINYQGTTYVVTSYGIFVCTNCAGIHRELNHKVKGLNLCNFTEEEAKTIEKWGNEVRLINRKRETYTWVTINPAAIASPPTKTLFE